MSQMVVVLDEDDSVFVGVAKLLEDEGYLVLPISTADGLVDELKDTQAAALLLDLQTGGPTAGLGALIEIERDGELASLPVLVYSADALQLRDLSPRLLERGYGILQKPFDNAQLLQWLRKRLG